jgi:ubiquinone/menaquinone biosynthesis C-methylase UbiE
MTRAGGRRSEEHLANDPRSELWGEHRARYRFAARWAAGCRVLDVATGAGFGLQMLDQAGANALGVDLDPQALAEARALAPTSRLVRADAARLPLPDASIDLVTSFETLEHVPDAWALLVELRRVLQPSGRLVLSTPNRAFATPAHHRNPFHVREFEAAELRELLEALFARVQLFGQRPGPAYRYVPYLLVERHNEPAALAWKTLNRLPFGLKDGLARRVSGRPFYPGESDYRFEPAALAGSHVLVAVAEGCR